MKPEIISLPPARLFGKSISHSMGGMNSRNLWHDFMTNRHLLTNRVDDSLLWSVQKYPPGYFQGPPQMDVEFISMACAEVDAEGAPPEGFHEVLFNGGLYAKFIHKGAVSEFYKTAAFIYQDWLPNSAYSLADNYHFEWLGPKYIGPDNLESIEEVFIPVTPK